MLAGPGAILLAKRGRNRPSCALRVGAVAKYSLSLSKSMRLRGGDFRNKTLAWVRVPYMNSTSLGL